MTPGEKIICINATRTDGVDYSMFSSWVNEGATYHVRRVEVSLDKHKRVLLDEIVNDKVYFKGIMGKAEPGFASTRFANYEDYVMGNVEENENIKENINSN